MFLLNGTGWISIRHFSPKFTGTMLLLSSVSALLLNPLLILIIPLPWRVIFKSTLALRQWLVYTIFSVIILSHLRIHSSRNFSLNFLHVFILIFSIILSTNTPRMMNQSILLILWLLFSILMIPPTFLKNFYVSFKFYAAPKTNSTTRTGTGPNKKAAGRERPATYTCPWQVILSPKSLRFWQGLLPASSTPLPTIHPFVAEIADAQKSFGCSSRLKPPVIRTEHSPGPLTEDAPPINPRIRTVGRLQTGRKLMELCTRTQPAPYIGGWHLATFLVSTATGRNKFVDLQPRTPRHPSYSRLQVPGWGEPPYFHPTGFRLLPALVPTLPTGQAKESPPAIPETQPREQECLLLGAHYLQWVAL